MTGMAPSGPIPRSRIGQGWQGGSEASVPGQGVGSGIPCRGLLQGCRENGKGLARGTDPPRVNWIIAAKYFKTFCDIKPFTVTCSYKDTERT